MNFRKGLRTDGVYLGEIRVGMSWHWQDPELDLKREETDKSLMSRHHRRLKSSAGI
jgi:hypothetical protein